MSDQVATIGDDRGVGYMVIAYNAFNAALLALGCSTTDSRLTNEVRAKLSNASTGGDFYVFAQSFKTQTQLLGDLPAWTFGARDFIDMWETTASSGTVGPYMDIFYSTVLPVLPPSAKSDLDTVLDGGDLGGGGSSGELPDGYIGGSGTVIDGYVTFECKIPYCEVSNQDLWWTDVNNATWTNAGNVANVIPHTVYVKVKQEYFARIPSQYSDYDNYFIELSRAGGSYGNAFTFNLFATPDELQYTLGTSMLNGQTRDYYSRLDNSSGKKIFVGAHSSRFNTDEVSFDGSIVTVDYVYPYDNLWTYTANSYSTYNTTKAIGYAKQAAGPPLPPNNWPDPPSDPTPTPPTVPDPPTDTPITQPTPPTDPTPPTYPITTIYEGDTYVTADISAILDAMDEHCQHLQLAIYNAANDIYDSLSDYLQDEFQATRQEIRDDFGWLGSCIHDEVEGLMDYLKELFEWLADQFDFSFTGDTYNDSTVVSWLKRIYLKLGGGEVNTRPTDPVADPKGIGKWLQDLWNNFLIDLVAIGSNGLGAVAEELQKLTTKFPFSIPWDIAALLALLSASPVAPVVDVPMWSLDSGYHLVKVHEMHIDMSVYNNYWEPVRIIEKIGFAVYLAMRTKDFMELLGLSSAKE